MLKATIRVSSFVRKEFAEVVRQPRLVLSLILGPFLILLLFGIGYSGEARVLRTELVVPAGTPLEQQAKEYAATLGKQLRLVRVTPDEEAAKNDLKEGKTDVVFVVPPDALNKIMHGEQASLTLYHNEIDPTQSGYVSYFGRLYVSEVNRRILLAVTDEAHKRADESQQEIQEAQAAIQEARTAINGGDRQRAREALDRLDRATTALAGLAGVSAGVMQGVKASLGAQAGDANPDSLAEDLQKLRDDAAELRRALDRVDQNATTWEVRLRRVEEDLSQLNEAIDRFKAIPPGVLVSPFTVQAESVAPLQPNFVIFYAPAVLALILQHMAVTMSALSLVRERLLGAIEVFRVSPISALEALLGKYLSYLLMSVIIGAILALLLATLLKVPVLGQWQDFGVALVLMLFASLGIGFAISAISGSDSQAVQLSMIVLLASMFFSGFVLPISALMWPIRVVSYFLPVTYGILTLQDVMLRGVPLVDVQDIMSRGVPAIVQDVMLRGMALPSGIYLLALLVEGVILFSVSLVIFRRQFVRA